MSRAAPSAPPAEKAAPDSIVQRPPAPPADIRTAATLVEANKPPWALVTLDEESRNRLAAIAGVPRPTGTAQRLVMAFEARGESLVAFERLEPAAVGDSGWCVGPITPAPEAHWQAVRAGDLLEARPDLAELVTLPVGYAVLLGAGGIMAVLDPQDNDVWSKASVVPAGT
jgi:hypothetical protein